MHTHEVLLGPIISEKSTDLSGDNKWVFRVNPQANKIEIRRAVEELFSVRVASVRTVTVRPKEKGAGFIAINKRRRGYTSIGKKAVVTLAPGERMREDFFGDV